MIKLSYMAFASYSTSNKHSWVCLTISATSKSSVFFKIPFKTPFVGWVYIILNGDLYHMDIDHFGYGLIWIWKMELYIIFRSLNPKRTNPQVAAPPVPVCFFRLHGLQVIPVLPVHIPGELCPRSRGPTPFRSRMVLVPTWALGRIIPWSPRNCWITGPLDVTWCNMM